MPWHGLSSADQLQNLLVFLFPSKMRLISGPLVCVFDQFAVTRDVRTSKYSNAQEGLGSCLLHGGPWCLSKEFGQLAYISILFKCLKPVFLEGTFLLWSA